MFEMPYFMTNKEWYEFDKNDLSIKLTNKATKKAKESFEEFMKLKKPITKII